MNNVLGEAFIKLFHEKTAHLEEGGPRLLHVDSHGSHVSLALLDFAVQHNIIVLGYPPHTTNLTQGLDVVVFTAFKKAYAKRAAEHYENTGHEVEKRDFLTVVHSAVQDSFTEANILCAWRKTGLRPVNRNTISNMDLAPSKAFSTTHCLPLAPFLPIRAVVNAIHHQNRLTDGPQSPTLRHSSHLPPTIVEEPTFNFTHDNLATLMHHADRASETVPESAGLDGSTELATEVPALDPSLQQLSHGLDTLALSDSSPSPSPNVSRAINTAGKILRGIATTSYSPLLKFDTVTSALDPPPVECGPFPMQLVQLLKSHQGLPSQQLWDTVKWEFIQLVSHSERQLATNILQHTFCQQVQWKLAQKETN
jgi:hypothetical protein